MFFYVLLLTFLSIFIIWRPQCIHRHWLWRPRRCVRFQCGSSGPLQVSSSLSLWTVTTWVVIDLFTYVIFVCMSPFSFLFFLFFRWVKQEKEFTKQAQAPDSTPKLDLGFKEGQTITLNIGVPLFLFAL